MSVITQRPRDCFSCKIASGFGLMGGGLYVAYHSRKFQGRGSTAMMTFACGLLGLGVARVLSLPPFHRPLEPQKTLEK